uniref:Dehydration-responsive element-binding protein 5-7 n=1 Tax=Syntrichia caninervis TaxID=200751 RepID=A0A144LHD8_9BRYO|nr:dehydration-responsive element-binding protein 5-7 [Syntrichia caninervis]
MVTSWKKCRRTSSEHAPPRRRRDALKKLVGKIVHSIVPESSSEYRGVRYRVELNKYVTEIRPSRSTKKIWLGTYDTAEEAARAFDIGNLCCKKNLPLNFPDSPRMLKRISSQLSPDEARSAIAKLAKEVARVVMHGGGGDSRDRAAAIMARELVVKAEEEEPTDLLQAHHLEASAAAATVTYTESLQETILVLDEDVESAASMDLDSGTSWSFTLGEIKINDDLEGIPGLGSPDFGTIQDLHSGDVYYFCN